MAWIVRLRWAAVAGVVATALLTRLALGAISGTSFAALLAVGAGMAGYNLLFARAKVGPSLSVPPAFAQVFLDLAALTIMLAFTGGVQNPFFLFYMFHIVIAGILLRKARTYAVAAIASALFCGLVVLQETGAVPSYPLGLGAGGAPLRVVAGGVHVAGVLAAFVTTAWCTAYFTSTIVDKLRRRGVQILEAKELVERERAKTEDIVRSVRAALLMLDPDGRIAWANDIAREWFGADLRGFACYAALWGLPRRCPSCHMADVLKTGAPATFERAFTRDGRQRFYLISCSPIRTGDGRVEQILELIQDITATKEMQIQLVQAGKMVAVGQLAAGIAHEINNPLAVVASSSEILTEEIRAGGASGELLARHLDRISGNVFRCKDIIQNLLAFARRDDGGLEPADVRALLDDTVQLVEANARARGREIQREYAGDLSVRTHPQKIQQIVINLLMNAVDATKPGERITVAAAPRDDGIEIAVADTGRGIAPEHLSRVFEPFFTTKPLGKGTGLGLYLCHRFVESLGGTIGVESRPERGTTFRVWVPANVREGSAA